MSTYDEFTSVEFSSKNKRNANAEDQRKFDFAFILPLHNVHAQNN